MTVLVVAETVAILLLALLVAGLLRSHAEILRALHELGVDLHEPGQGAQPISLRPSPRNGVPAPEAGPAADIVGVSPLGEGVSVAVVGAEQDTLLAFLTSGCSTCAAFWDTFAAGAPSVPAGARLVILTKDPDEESLSAVRSVAPADVPVVMSSQAWQDYAVPVVPYFVHVDGPSGTVVGQGAGASWDQVVSLITRALGDAAAPTSSTTPKARADAEREERADRDLLRAGIRPGDPSLYPPTVDEPTP